MTTPTKYYLKFLNHDRMPAHGGIDQWPEPGVWTEEVEPVPCRQGWHLCRKQDIFDWSHEALWVVETDGDVVVDPQENNKVVARRARLVRQIEEWNPKTQRLFAVDCAEHVLHLFETEHPNDDRPRTAIETTRRFVLGEVSVQELLAAESTAWIAAMSARFDAGSAADSAARFAAQAAAWSSSWSAAGSVARFTTLAATLAAAWSSAERDEHTWQINHLFAEYLKLDQEEFH